jgi:hypothetical protein
MGFQAIAPRHDRLNRGDAIIKDRGGGPLARSAARPASVHQGPAEDAACGTGGAVSATVPTRLWLVHQPATRSSAATRR